MSEWCAIGAWRHYAGKIHHDVWVKRRGQDAIDKVMELIAMRFDSVRADTVENGIFVFVEDGSRKGDHDREFIEWCRKT